MLPVRQCPTRRPASPRRDFPHQTVPGFPHLSNGLSWPNCGRADYVRSQTTRAAMTAATSMLARPLTSHRLVKTWCDH
jgi:hypothetical protein